MKKYKYENKVFNTEQEMLEYILLKNMFGIENPNRNYTIED